MKRDLIALSAVVVLILGGCETASLRQNSDSQDTIAKSQPHVTQKILAQPKKITRAVATDFENQNTVTREITTFNNLQTAQFSVTQMPNQNLALMINTARRDVRHVEFYIDLDHDSSTGLQLNSRTSWRDTNPQPDGNIGADLIVVDGNLHYFNRATRSWRWWYLSWQRVMSIDFNANQEDGMFIAELPSSFLTREAPADRERYHAYEHYGFVDYSTVVERFNNNIRVGVAMFDQGWNNVFECIESINFNYNPDTNLLQNSLSAEVTNNELHINISLLENEANSRNQIFLRDEADENRFGGYLLEGRNLFRYVGDGNNWRWEFSTQVRRTVNNNTISIVIPIRELNLNGNISLVGQLLTRDWGRLRRLEPITTRIENNGDDEVVPFWNGTNTGPSINITANLADITPNDRVQFFIRDRANQDRYSGFLVEGNVLYRYTGDGHNWRWERVGEVEANRDGNTLTVSIPTNMANFPQDGIAFLRTWSRDWTQSSFFGPDNL